MRPFMIAAVLLAGACGGGSKYTIDDNVLAQVPLQEKQAMMAAQQERSIAGEQLLKAKADVAQADRERDIAENEYKASKLTVGSAELTKKSAEATGDVNRKAAAEHDLHVAELGKRAADAKLEWAKKRGDWLSAERVAAERQVKAADAKYELEKAKLASAKGIRPSNDFNVANFEIESLGQSKSHAEAKLEADKMKVEVDTLERTYRERNEEWASARGAAGH
jgi:hypothetical protein